MKIKLILAIAFLTLTVAIAGKSKGSHPDYPNNGKGSPRFYASPPGHPKHP